MAAVVPTAIWDLEVGTVAAVYHARSGHDAVLLCPASDRPETAGSPATAAAAEVG